MLHHIARAQTGAAGFMPASNILQAQEWRTNEDILLSHQ